MSHCVSELNSKVIFNCLLITAVEPLILLHAAAAADDDKEQEEQEDDCEGDGDGDGDDDENDGICIILRQMWRTVRGTVGD